MAILHYQVSKLDHSWVVSCEDVPIDMFYGRKAAMDAAMKLVVAARARGDKPFLHVDRVSQRHRTAIAQS